MSFDIGKFTATAPAKERDIETVTGEVLKLKRQAGNTMIAIGQRLQEAKDMLPHGEWLPWLRDRVEFSERMAQQLMQLAREMSNPQTFADLEPSKVLALLAVPAEEREAFATETHMVNGEEKTVAEMTVREVKQVVKESKTPVEAEPYTKTAPAAQVQQIASERCESAAGFDGEAYIAERNKEDDKYFRELAKISKRLAEASSKSQTRRDGIESLKNEFGWSHCSHYDGDISWKADPSGYAIGGLGKEVHRTWSEVWDMLAVHAIRNLASESMQSQIGEGQLMICGWMPGGTFPREPGQVVADFDIGLDKPTRRICWYENGKFLLRSGEPLNLTPLKWIQLPPDKED